MKSKKNNKKTILIISLVLLLVVIIIVCLILKQKTTIYYEITYNGINCPTPYVEFSSDGTYEYYEHYGIGENKPKPKNGSYKYNMDKLIENINNYEEDNKGPYTVKLSTGEEYTTYSTNKELRELLDGNNIVLEKCMTIEEE